MQLRPYQLSAIEALRSKLRMGAMRLALDEALAPVRAALEAASVPG